MMYFTKVTATFQTKNKAHKEIQDYATSKDSFLLPDDEAKNQLIREFTDKVNEANENNPRCHDIVLEVFSSFLTNSGQTIEVSVAGNFQINIYKIEHAVQHSPLKIFEIHQDGETTWVAATTLEEAQETFLEMEAEETFDHEGTILEVPEEKWEELTIRNNEYNPDNDHLNWKTMTFAEYMKRLILADIITSTKFD